jgi:hypothetical protein
MATKQGLFIFYSQQVSSTPGVSLRRAATGL